MRHTCGDEVTICLPLRIAPDAEAPDTGAIGTLMHQTIAEKTSARVLLVEDYEPNVLVARAFLEQFGYAVEVATNGMEAVELVKAGAYAAALMDVQMHGMNGLEATQFIRAFEAREGRARLPIIGMTAHALAGDRERCLQAGMDEYISKPVLPDILALKLGQLR